MSIERKLTGSIDLEKLVHVKRKMKGKNGQVDVLVIPIKANGLYSGEKGTYMNIDTIIKGEPDQYDNIGFMAKQTGYKNVYGQDKKWEDITEEQREHLDEISPILGNVKNVEVKGGSQKFDDVPDLDDDEENDLPF